ncbi:MULTISPECIES: site-specific integrase [Trichocoleus]|uniref:Site-specific integrase n=1 Tax=Trichocoleus desertorum GB2-A4 TaxID=2933944 RepID=A0ABV0J626_9CYAN|nr:MULTISPECIES: site-specific integrase [unclassified Trichocoleus]MBD1863344.1 site-specific integrase [Trichocoleus sp. FACHB-46]MBD2123717.1 site-specific integrase [Trichocoleus sp. FACHB-262]
MTDANQALDAKILQVNQRLKAAKLGLQIERRGQKLNLRGTLPPRPDSSRLRPHQQRLVLGLSATPSGLKQAEQEVKVIAAQLIQKTFDWRHYLAVSGGGRLYDLDLPEQIQVFEEHFLMQPQRIKNSASAKTTWRFTYAPYLRKLVAIAQEHPKFSLAEAIYATVRSTDDQSRSRQACCTALSALAEFLNLELPIDLKSLWGSYSPNQTQARELPSDELIVKTFEQIPNPAWRFVYGIMATYGLRNHEVFFSDYSGLSQGDAASTIQVLSTTKTGSHEVWPFFPEWIEQFDLRSICLPPVDTDLNRTTLQRVGQQVTTQFRRYQVPFSPYDLRHAWAVRTIHFGLPDTVAARMMGHSVTVHTRTYHQWLTRRDQQQAVEAALNRTQLKAPLR